MIFQPRAMDRSCAKKSLMARRAGLTGFVFNTRRPPFDDRRVREALALAFDFEWLNARFFRGEQKRIDSYFSGSTLGFDGPASVEERRLLEPFAATLPPRDAR